MLPFFDVDGVVYSAIDSNRVLKNRAWGCDPALCGFCKCSPILNMLRFPKRRTPWLTAWCLFFNTQIALLAQRAGRVSYPVHPVTGSFL
jgi:hypothetical protein